MTCQQLMRRTRSIKFLRRGVIGCHFLGRGMRAQFSCRFTDIEFVLCCCFFLPSVEPEEERS